LTFARLLFTSKMPLFYPRLKIKRAEVSLKIGLWRMYFHYPKVPFGRHIFSFTFLSKKSLKLSKPRRDCLLPEDIIKTSGYDACTYFVLCCFGLELVSLTYKNCVSIWLVDYLWSWRLTRALKTVE
jgi:hypothetical protein